jgi:hypothetical protein
MSSIQETILIDCNSVNSEEGSGRSLSIFTNHNDPIEVNAGDTCSIHSAFISELGAGADAVEFSNDYLETKTITHTVLTSEYPLNACNTKYYGYQSVSASNVETPVEVRGNKTSIAVGFYKSNNGENCYSLPRRFLYRDVPGLADWSSEDSETLGKVFHSSVIDTENGSFLDSGKVQSYVVDKDYTYYQSYTSGAGNLGNASGWVLKHDNNRFQIFVREKTYYGEQVAPATNPPATNEFSPANFEYLEFLKKVDIELPEGFNSPTNISDEITNTFRRQEQPLNVEYYSQAYTFNNASRQKFINVSTKINSNFYSTFFAGTPFTNSSSTYGAWETNGAGGTEDEWLRYLSSYQYIGIKRPELFAKGRKLARLLSQQGGFDLLANGYVNLRYDLPITNFERDSNASLAHTIVLDLLWTDEHLETLRDIFLEQGKYPELFENRYNQFYGYTTVNNSRFLHIDQYEKTNKEATLLNYLGSDNMYGGHKAKNYVSCPFFFDYNPAYATTKTTGNSWESGYAYGFAKKVVVGGIEKIALTTKHFGIAGNASLSASYTTLPYTLFATNNASGNVISKDTNLGWDIHFNAYSSACIGLTTGYTSEMYNQTQYNLGLPTLYTSDGSTFNPSIETYNAIQEIYLGADEPVLSFNTERGRFELAQLHTPEFVSSRYNAGGVSEVGSSGSATEDYIAEEVNSGNRVFKINKRLTNSNYTPSMVPYNYNYGDSVKIYTDYAQHKHANFQIDNLPPHLEKWVIYDSLCGVVIKDFGVSEANWDNCIWGVLGFTYNQFNAVETSENNLTTRVGTNNKNSLPYAFTNADIQSGDTISYNTNNFGAGMYNLSLPLTMSFNTDVNNPVQPTVNYRVECLPAITEKQDSVVLSAPNLPRKLKNGYFTVRSDLLEDSNYRSKGNLYPVIGVVDKVNDTGDFYTGSGSLEFTFTKNKVISSIRTMITTPQQTLARLDKGSSVIYRITRNRIMNYDIVSEILNK